MIIIYQNNIIGHKERSLNDILYIYKKQSNTYTKIDAINFGDLTSAHHLGLYSYTQNA